MKFDDYDRIKKGDCFLLKIDSKKYVKYKNMSLVFFVTDKIIDNNSNKKIVVQIKLVRDEVDTNCLKDLLNKSEFIRTKMTWLEARFFPIDASKKLKDYLIEIEKKPVFPNEYGMLFEYEYIIIVTNSKTMLSECLEYLGNYDIDSPVQSFTSQNYANTPFVFINHIVLEKFINLILDSYENFNLKKSPLFDKNNSNKERKFWIDLLNTLPYGERFVQEMKKMKAPLLIEEESLTKVYPE